MKYRVLELEANTAATNMAIDEAVSESVQKGSNPLIRFYKWRPSAVSIGYFQSMDEEVAVPFCEENNIDLVRRRTGGGAVYHDFDGEITYSIIGKEDLFPKDLIASYKLICGWIVDALSALDIEAEFKPINDIITNSKKISGNAQTRRQGVLLQHGTLLYGLDVATMFTCLKVPKEKISDKMISDVKQRVTSLKDVHPEITEKETYDAMLSAFTKDKEFELSDLTSDERNRVAELIEQRYANKDWNFWR